MTDLELLVNGINAIADKMMLFTAITLGATFLIFYLFEKVENHLSERLAKRIENLLMQSCLWSFNLGIIYALIHFIF